jgi:hypothetical protein
MCTFPTIKDAADASIAAMHSGIPVSWPTAISLESYVVARDSKLLFQLQPGSHSALELDCPYWLTMGV